MRNHQLKQRTAARRHNHTVEGIPWLPLTSLSSLLKPEADLDSGLATKSWLQDVSEWNKGGHITTSFSQLVCSGLCLDAVLMPRLSEGDSMHSALNEAEENPECCMYMARRAHGVIYIYIYMLDPPQDPPGELYMYSSVSPSKHWASDSSQDYCWRCY